MTKKQIALLGAVAVAAIYLCFFVDWFASGDILVTHTVRLPSAAKRPRPGAPDLGHPVSPVAFTLNRKCRLTELKVVNAAEFATNQYARPLWHLVSNSASAPTKGFVYGGRLRGMRLRVADIEAEPLQPNVTYRLILHAGKLKIEHDFKGPAVRIARR
jgi:hypothetical protein